MTRKKKVTGNNCFGFNILFWGLPSCRAPNIQELSLRKWTWTAAASSGWAFVAAGEIGNDHVVARWHQVQTSAEGATASVRDFRYCNYHNLAANIKACGVLKKKTRSVTRVPGPPKNNFCYCCETAVCLYLQESPSKASRSGLRGPDLHSK